MSTRPRSKSGFNHINQDSWHFRLALSYRGQSVFHPKRALTYWLVFVAPSAIWLAVKVAIFTCTHGWDWASYLTLRGLRKLGGWILIPLAYICGYTSTRYATTNQAMRRQYAGRRFYPYRYLPRQDRYRNVVWWMVPGFGLAISGLAYFMGVASHHTSAHDFWRSVAVTSGTTLVLALVVISTVHVINRLRQAWPNLHRRLSLIADYVSPRIVLTPDSDDPHMEAS